MTEHATPAPGPTGTSPPRRRHVAVIVVHGVGHHEPAASVTAIARMLLRIPEDRPSHYTAFRQLPLRLPTRPVPAAGRAEETARAAAAHTTPTHTTPAPPAGFGARLLQFDEGTQHVKAILRSARATSHATAHPTSHQTSNSAAHTATHTQVPADVAFMRSQLRGYATTGADQVYESVRLEGQHLTRDTPAGPRRVDADVHLYEAYWSDISRLGNSITSIFGSFYQLVIHLPYVGRQTLEHARAYGQVAHSRTWALWDALYVGALRTFTLAIPLSNIFLLAVGLLLVARNVWPWMPTAVLAGSGLLAALTYRVRRGERRGLVDGVVVLAGGAAGWLAGIGVAHLLVPPDWVAAVELWCAITVLLYQLLVAFNDQRPGALLVGIGAWVATSACLVWAVATRHSLAYGVLDTIAYLYTASVACWIVFGALFASSVLCGWAAGRRRATSRPDGTAWPDVARRVAFTTRLTLAVPAILFSALSLVLWASLMAGAAERLLPNTAEPIVGVGRLVSADSAPYAPRLTFPVLDRLRQRDSVRLHAARQVVAARQQQLQLQPQQVPPQRANTTAQPPGCRVTSAPEDSTDLAAANWAERACLAGEQHALQDSAAALRSARYALHAVEGISGTRLGHIAFAIVGVAVLLLVVALSPVLLTELRPPATSAWPGGSSAATSPNGTPAARDSYAARLGTWLSASFRAGRVSALLCTLVVILSPLVQFAGVPLPHALATWGPLGALRAYTVAQLSPGLITYGALIVGASGLGLIALSRRFASIGLGLRPALSAALDVDNYLRTMPRSRTPRALMVERYVSLLRYVCNWRDTEDATAPDAAHGYDAVIIVAHSQGTVLTADVLRYLAWERRTAAQSPTRPAFESELDPFTAPDHPLGIQLFTMGSPLRQLYALRFPDLYRWITPTGASGWTPDSDTPHPSPADLLGVTRWINAYRSGDYVGRAIWAAPDDDASLYEPGRCTAGGATTPIEEYCIGTGAHTHYWDETATAVAEQLDALIRDAIAASATRSPTDGSPVPAPPPEAAYTPGVDRPHARHG